jgi:hypothetical protein
MADYGAPPPEGRPAEVAEWEKKRKGKKYSELGKEEPPPGYAVQPLTSDEGEERWGLVARPEEAPGMTPAEMGQAVGKTAVAAAGGPAGWLGAGVPPLLEAGGQVAQAGWNMVPQEAKQFIAGAVPGVSLTAEMLAEKGAQGQQAIPTVEGPVPAGPVPGQPPMPGQPPGPGGMGMAMGAGGGGRPGAAARLEEMGQEQLKAAEVAEANEELYRQELQDVAEQRMLSAQEQAIRSAENVQELSDAATAAYTDTIRQTSVVDMQEKASKQRQESEARLAELNAEYDELKDGEIDPAGRFSKSGPKALATLAIIFGGIGSALTGEPNRALKIIMDTIDQDVGFAQAERKEKRRFLGERMGREMEYIDKVMELSQDEIEGTLMIRREKMDLYENHLNWLAQTHKTDEMRALAGDIALGLREEKVRINQEMDQHAYDREAKARATAMDAAAKASQERRGWAQIRMQKEATAAEQRLATYANAKEIKMLESMRGRVEELTEQYRNLPSRAFREIENLIPFAETDTKKYVAAVETLARPWYRTYMRERMTDGDAKWAETTAFANIHENKNVGLARMRGTLEVMEMVEMGRTAALEAAGLTMNPTTGKYDVDRQKFTAYLDRAAGAAE